VVDADRGARVQVDVVLRDPRAVAQDEHVPGHRHRDVLRQRDLRAEPLPDPQPGQLRGTVSAPDQHQVPHRQLEREVGAVRDDVATAHDHHAHAVVLAVDHAVAAEPAPLLGVQADLVGPHGGRVHRGDVEPRPLPQPRVRVQLADVRHP
jgi:hypothetical protein